MAKITENYKTEIGRFEEPDILVKYEKMSNKINKHFKKTNKGMNAWTAQKSFNWTNKMSKVEFRKFMENLTSREMAKEEVENVNGKAVSFYYPFEETIS